MDKTPQYQRAVTPTIDNGMGVGYQRSPKIEGKLLNYNAASKVKRIVSYGSTSEKLQQSNTFSGSGPRVVPLPSPRGQQQHGSSSSSASSSSAKGVGIGGVGIGSIFFEGGGVGGSIMIPPRQDIVPLSDELPADGIVFARGRNNPELLVVFRTPEERLRSPERLNLDRRQLESCPYLEQEQRLRLLNYQNNLIKSIQNVDNLPNLIFLDVYNNKIHSLEGPLSLVKGLRVLMAGKNKISCISNLSTLRKLDVLDLHSNEIRVIEGLDGLADLRVLNLAGNKISIVHNLSTLVSLTELNLRRNSIECVKGLHKLPGLQRVFLSHNLIRTINDVGCLFEVSFLIELSLDGNPVSVADPIRYRNKIIGGMSGLRHLDLKRITDEERISALRYADDEEGFGTSSGGSSIGIDAGTRRAINNAEIDDGDTGCGKRGGNVEVDVDREPLVSEVSGNSVAYPNLSGDGLNSGMMTSSSRNYSGTSTAASGIGRDDDADNNMPPSMVVTNSSSQSGQGDGALARLVHGGTTTATTTTTTASGKGAPVPAQDFVSPPPASLATLARNGQLSNTESLFDIEVIGPNEKAMICVGETWEAPANKKLLGNVVELSLFHMKGPAIVAKLGSLLSSRSLPCLTVLRLHHNDFHTIKHVEILPDIFSSSGVKDLVIKENPICSSTSINMLRAYLIASMPSLLSFNGSVIDSSERESAELKFSHLLNVRSLVTDNPFVHAHSSTGRSLVRGDTAAAKINSGASDTRGNKSGSTGGYSSTNPYALWSQKRRGNIGSRAQGEGGEKDGEVSSSATTTAVASKIWAMRERAGKECNELQDTFDSSSCQIPSFTQNALFHREVASEFSDRFEKVVLSIIFDTLTSLKRTSSS